jgi:hypothetical protein
VTSQPMTNEIQARLSQVQRHESKLKKRTLMMIASHDDGWRPEEPVRSDGVDKSGARAALLYCTTACGNNMLFEIYKSSNENRFVSLLKCDSRRK